MNRRTTLAAALATAAAPALAQSPHAGHGVRPREAPSTRAFREANARMHRAMDIRFTGNADRDFAAAMIPHHEGAIEMARIVLAHGQDAETRALAEAIIQEQSREIAQMRAILARLPAR
jgi:uncharacterized protein (DUF305 family)